MNKVRKATITLVKPSWFETDTLGYRRQYVGYVQATDETGMVHNFINGSWNRVLQDVQVGDEGYVEFVSSGSMALWYWRPKG